MREGLEKTPQAFVTILSNCNLFGTALALDNVAKFKLTQDRAA
jgi:hypothetical protein